MNGNKYRATMSKKIDFSMRRSDATPIDEIEWDQATVRLELQRLLIWQTLCPLDLLRVWSKEKEGEFNKKEVCMALRAAPVPSLASSASERWRPTRPSFHAPRAQFTAMMKRMVNRQDIWDKEYRHVCKDIFQKISGGDASVDVIEFERWLNKGWLKEKTAFLATTPNVVAIAKNTEVSTKHASAAAVSAITVMSQRASSSPTSMLSGGLGKARLPLSQRQLTPADRKHEAARIIQRNCRLFVFRRRATIEIEEQLVLAKKGDQLTALWTGWRCALPMSLP